MTKYTITCNQQKIDLTSPRVMGILNITPDSFFEKSCVVNSDLLLKKANDMLEEGATFLDLGGHSTRPNAPAVSESEEADRVLPAVEVIHKNYPNALLSIDTFRVSIAQQAVKAGACIVNDVSGGLMDANMYEAVAKLAVPYILMHMRGTIDTMTQYSTYEHITKEIYAEIAEKIANLKLAGVKDIIVDLGFGFSKTADQNYHLLNNLEVFAALGYPILTGLSRKSMIWRKLNINPDNALNGTTALNTIALLKGSSILRVHDVKEAMETIKLIELLKNS